MRVTYANCFADPRSIGDVLLTDELTVARAVPPGVRTIVADELYDGGEAQALNQRLCALGFDWVRVEGEDPTLVHGVSAADLAGLEAVQTLLLPAARAVLALGAALEEASPATFVSVLPAGGGPIFQRIEAVSCDAADATVRQRLGPATRIERHASDDPRNRALVEKYARTRDPRFLVQESLGWRALTRAACAAVNLAAAGRGRRRPSVAVLQYNPTAGFARRFAAFPRRPLSLTRMRFGRPDLAGMLHAGDRALAPYRGRPSGAGRAAAARLDEHLRRHEDALRARLSIAGVDLLDVFVPRLRALVAAYAGWADARAPAVRRALRRARAQAVLVPYDGHPEARLLVRVAQSEGVPTVVLNDGWKGDDHSTEGAACDYALAWSESIAQRYYSRWLDPGRIAVTGDPRSDGHGWPSPRPPAAGPLRRVLVGTFTFSPIDLNCRRSDPERFLEQVLEGIRHSRRGRGAEVVVKLHPADRERAYADVLPRFGDLDLRVVAEGDVLDLFPGADAYVTNYSTSLLEAAAAGLAFAYYRVNAQRLHPPFQEDPVMAARTAATPQELAGLLDDPAFADLGDQGRARAWVERHLGPRDGRCTERVAGVLERIAAARAPGQPGAYAAATASESAIEPP